MIEIISACLIPICVYIIIINLIIVIHGALYDISVALPDVEKLAPQLKEWLSAQRHVAYDATTLGEIFSVSNRAINGSMISLMRNGLIDYNIIDNIKYYYYRED